jgi:zinc protease
VNAATLIIAAAGDLTPDAFIREVGKRFAAVPRTTYALTEVTTPDAIPNAAPKRETKYIAGKASIDYMIGLRLGITEDHPDYPALMVGLRVLGNPGGFTGRLMQQVREKEGLTYGTYAYLAGLDGGADGYAMAWATFAPQLFPRGRTALMGEIEKILHDGATDQEVRRQATRWRGPRSRRSCSRAAARRSWAR